MPSTWRRPCAALPEAIVIREATPADAAAVARLHRETWRTTYTGILPLDVIERLAGRRSEDLWRARLAEARPPAATWIAEVDGEAAGFAACGAARHLLEGLEAEIYALYVLQQRQRLGAGRELVRACARHFVRNGLFGFYLWVLKANRARLFYEALGGEEVGEKSERLGLHSFAEVAYAWHDLASLVDCPQSPARQSG
jgi:ribosomal protein S18 acetylase RimI-like enzyme